MSFSDAVSLIRWMRSNGVFGGLESLRQAEPRVRIRKSAVIIENVGTKDGGLYAFYADSNAVCQISLVSFAFQDIAQENVEYPLCTTSHDRHQLRTGR